MNHNRQLFVVLSLLPLMGLSESMDNNITQANSAAFSEKVKTAKISPETAYKIVTEKISETNLYRIFNKMYFIVGDNYVFSGIPNKMGIINMSGYYVNMNDGKIEFRETRERFKMKIKSFDDYYKF